MQTFSYESMGTKWEISIWPESQATTLDTKGEAWRLLKKEIFELSDNFDKTYSRFKSDSLVTKISKQAGVYEVPEEFINMLQIYFDLYEKSEKKLNPLIGFSISDLGYDENYSLKEKETIRKVPDLFETLSIVRKDAHCGIITKEAVLFDFGALGKGYFVDKIVNLLKRKNFNHFLVNGSGDIYYFGEETANFGLEDPEDPTKIIGKLEIKKEDKFRAFCASGTNRRRWNGKTKELNHQLDATTLEPADFVLATWVQCENCALADALATCLFLSPPGNFLPPSGEYNFEYLIMNKNREIKKSPNFAVELF